MRGPDVAAASGVAEIRPAVPPFAARLIAWQRHHGRRGLPWQGTRDPYRIWLSEVMLQQTQVTTVIPYYQRFCEAFPDVAALAAAPLDGVLARWSGLGYYRRAQHLHAAARAVMRDHGGIFPREVAAIAALPGIGRSTAAAIAVFAFGTRGAILDGNVKRVLARRHAIDGFPGTSAVKRQLWERATAALPDTDIESYTQGLMDLGATVCVRQRPRCDVCPVAEDCRARLTQRVHALPAARAARVVPRRAVRMLLLDAGGAILLERRPVTGIWGGLWSLPESDPAEDVHVVCAMRYQARIASLRELPRIEHAFTHYRLTIHPLHVTLAGVPPSMQAPGQTWLDPAEALEAALPAPVRRLLRTFVPGATTALC